MLKGGALALAAALSMSAKLAGVLVLSGWLPVKSSSAMQGLPVTLCQARTLITIQLQVLLCHGRADLEVEPGAAQVSITPRGRSSAIEAGCRLVQMCCLVLGQM